METLIIALIMTMAGGVLGAWIANRHGARRKRQLEQTLVTNTLTIDQIKQRAAARRATTITREEIEHERETVRKYVTDNLSDRGLADYVNGILNGSGTLHNRTDQPSPK